MSEGPQFPIPVRNKSKSSEIDSLKTLLETLPYAALIIDTDARRILFANPPVAEISAYARDEIYELELASLFIELPDHIFDGPDADESEEHILVNQSLFTELVSRNQTTLPVKLEFIPLNNEIGRALIFVEPDPLLTTEEGMHPRFIQFWEGLNSLLDIATESEVNSAISKTLQAGSLLSGASNLAVYQGEPHSPMLSRRCTSGDERLFPEQIPIQEWINLRQTELWVSGKRPATSLHRQARSKNLSFLASSPLGQPNAMVGLLVFADESAPAYANILQIAQFLAATLTTIIEYHSQKSKDYSNKIDLETQLRSHTTIEGHLGEGVLTLNSDLMIQRMNPSSEMMLGYATHEVVGEYVENILIGSESLNPMLQAAQRGSPTYKLNNVRLFRRNGEAFLALIRAFPVLVDEQIVQIVVLLEDLSEQEQMRLKAQHFEQRANVGEFTAEFAHEIRNPINNISIGLQALAANMDKDDPNQDSVARMLQDCERLADLIKRVLSLSRQEDYKMEPLDLPQMLKRLLERLRPRMVRLEVEYDLHADPDCPPIYGDLHALEEVFINLISNAMNAMEKTGGRLGLKVKPINTPDNRVYLEVSVADTGPGIPHEIQERVFEPFFTATKRGTGLGLAIAKRIVTAHKGNIRLDSFPGGTVFFVQLPTTNSNR